MKFEFHEKWKDLATGRFNKHVYLLDGKQATGVTTVLGVIAKNSLIQWAANLAAAKAFVLADSMNGALGALAEDILKHEKITSTIAKELDSFPQFKEARLAHAEKRDSAADTGTLAHKDVEEYIKLMISDQDGIAKGINGGHDNPMVERFIQWAVSNKVKFLESEKKVYSESWFVAGTLDFTAIINGKRFICDLKTMDRLWDRQPHFQAAAYMKMAVEMGEESYDGTLIVNINKETNELTEYYSYDWEADIKSFEAALTLYRTLDNG